MLVGVKSLQQQDKKELHTVLHSPRASCSLLQSCICSIPKWRMLHCTFTWSSFGFMSVNKPPAVVLFCASQNLHRKIKTPMPFLGTKGHLCFSNATQCSNSVPLSAVIFQRNDSISNFLPLSALSSQTNYNVQKWAFWHGTLLKVTYLKEHKWVRPSVTHPKGTSWLRPSLYIQLGLSLHIAFTWITITSLIVIFLACTSHSNTNQNDVKEWSDKSSNIDVFFFCLERPCSRSWYESNRWLFLFCRESIGTVSCCWNFEPVKMFREKVWSLQCTARVRSYLTRDEVFFNCRDPALHGDLSGTRKKMTGTYFAICVEYASSIAWLRIISKRYRTSMELCLCPAVFHVA